MDIKLPKVMAEDIGQFLAPIVLVLVLVIFSCGFMYMSWKAERFINWKFSYSDRIEERIANVEKRVELLETILEEE